MAIEDGIEEGMSASAIARRLGVSASTVTREVERNRTVRESKAKKVRPARKCGRYPECRRARSACAACRRTGRGSSCRLCKEAVCCDECPDFEPRACALRERWPYVCSCDKAQRASCDLPKARYSARRAQEAADARLGATREGPRIGAEAAAGLADEVRPMIESGLSAEAIWADAEARGEPYPVDARTFRGWVERGVVDVPRILLPRAVRWRRHAPRREPGRDRVDRTGRTFDDFMALPAAERARAVQGDTVEGFSWNVQRLASLEAPPLACQLFWLLPGGDPDDVVGMLDEVERGLGSPGAFGAALGVLLVDRGREFDDWEGMERSCLEPGARRCRVFYCDPQSSHQKGSCERAHAELRRILPKSATDFDALRPADAALVCSHLASYPRPQLGFSTPFQASQGHPFASLFGVFGVEEVPFRDVMLRPDLVPHAKCPKGARGPRP